MWAAEQEQLFHDLAQDVSEVPMRGLIRLIRLIRGFGVPERQPAIDTLQNLPVRRRTNGWAKAP